MKSRKDKSLPVLCTEALFLKVWAEHDEIECVGACGHTLSARIVAVLKSSVIGLRGVMMIRPRSNGNSWTY